MSTRTKKRSHSGAQTPYPHCGKKLSGAKGVKMHVAREHSGDGK
jgi:hypothetical protein